MRRNKLVLFLIAVFFSMVLPATAEVPLPDDLKQYPMYEGAVVQQSMNMGEGVFAMLQLPQGASTDSVIDFYKKYFKGAGWTMVIEMRQETGGTLSFSKDKDQVMISVDFSDAQGFYTIVHSKNE